MGLGKVVGKQRMRTIEDAAGGQRVGGCVRWHWAGKEVEDGDGRSQAVVLVMRHTALR